MEEDLSIAGNGRWTDEMHTSFLDWMEARFVRKVLFASRHRLRHSCGDRKVLDCRSPGISTIRRPDREDGMQPRLTAACKRRRLSRARSTRPSDEEQDQVVPLFESSENEEAGKE